MTPSPLSPADRARVALEDAIAEAYRQGEQAGTAKVLRYLTLIVTATDDASRIYAIKQAERELAKWGV